MQGSAEPGQVGASALLKALVFLMFAMFAMTTDSVGTVIPQIIREFHLGLAAAGSFQYASMSGIGLSAIALGFLADRIGLTGVWLAYPIAFLTMLALQASYFQRSWRRRKIERLV